MLIFTVRAVEKSYYNISVEKNRSPGCTYVLFRFLDVRCASVIDWQQTTFTRLRSDTHCECSKSI